MSVHVQYAGQDRRSEASQREYCRRIPILFIGAVLSYGTFIFYNGLNRIFAELKCLCFVADNKATPSKYLESVASRVKDR
jgi:hypothetical protein